jgi:uncharacterized protein (DUF952 family)
LRLLRCCESVYCQDNALSATSYVFLRPSQLTRHLLPLLRRKYGAHQVYISSNMHGWMHGCMYTIAVLLVWKEKGHKVSHGYVRGCRGAAGDYVLLHLRESKLTHEVKYEAAMPVGDTKPPSWHQDNSKAALFPHVYGPLNRSGVEVVTPVERENDGTFLRFGHA